MEKKINLIKSIKKIPHQRKIFIFKTEGGNKKSSIINNLNINYFFIKFTDPEFINNSIKEILVFEPDVIVWDLIDSRSEDNIEIVKTINSRFPGPFKALITDKDQIKKYNLCEFDFGLDFIDTDVVRAILSIEDLRNFGNKL